MDKKLGLTFHWRIILFTTLMIFIILGFLSWFIMSTIQEIETDTAYSKLDEKFDQVSGEITRLFAQNASMGNINIYLQNQANEHYVQIDLNYPGGEMITAFPESREPYLDTDLDLDDFVIGSKSRVVIENIRNHPKLVSSLHTLILDQSTRAVVRITMPVDAFISANPLFARVFWGGFGLALLILITGGVAILLQATDPLQSIFHRIQAYTTNEQKYRSLEKIPLPSNSYAHSYNRFSEQINSQLEELRTKREILLSVLDNMTDGIIILNNQLQVVLINPAAQELFGVQNIETSQITLIEIVRNHQIVDVCRESLRSGTHQTVSFESGRNRNFFRAVITPYRKTYPESILIIIQDLTRIKHLEIVRRDFVSNVSHELRTPLASIRALAETLQEGALEDPPAAKRFLYLMEKEIDNVTQLVEELLELSKIESGRSPINKKQIHPCDLLKNACDRMKLQVERSRLLLEYQCSYDLPLIDGDQQKLEQVFINLIHNSIKFSHPGGFIRLSARLSEDSVIFSIQDNGLGISKSDLERIFERFYKSDKARTGSGTGLGLSISRHMIKAHGGKIWAESEPGVGSTFFIALPAVLFGKQNL